MDATKHIIVPANVRALKRSIRDVYLTIAEACLDGPATLDARAIADAAGVSPRLVADALSTLLALTPPVMARAKRVRQKSVYTVFPPTPRGSSHANAH